MQPPRLITYLILGVSALLVAALVGVLYLQLQAPEDEDGPPAPIARLADASRDAPALPVPAPATSRGPGGSGTRSLQPPAPERLGPDLIIGRVVDARSGEPVTNFRVDVLAAGPGSPLERLLAAHDRGERSRPFQTRSGVFRLDRKAGSWDIVVRAPGFLPAEIRDLVVPLEDAQPVLIEMDPGPTLTGLVYDVDGVPVPDVPVFLHVTRLEDGGKPPGQTVTSTAWDGRFRFSALSAGTYAVSVLEPENEIDRYGGILVQGGTVDISIPLTPRHHLVVCVKDGYGRPVREAGVELRRDDGNGFASGNTLPSGQVTLRHLTSGDYTLHVTRDGYADAEQSLRLSGGSGQMVRWITLASR
ncbi:MAG: carboxypeptidase-like regulatory domain-containing protein [Planctomycetota bacterium]|jgi:hypothetical protein